MTALMGLTTRLRLARLLAVTDAHPDSNDLGSWAADVFAGGIDLLELTERRPDAATREVLRQIRDSAPRRGLVAVADPDLAVSIPADVVVLSGGISAKKTRHRLHRWALIGRSCRSHAEIDRALADEGVHFLIVDADPATIAHAVAQAPPSDPAAKPWFAAGGLTPDDLPALMAAGCRRVALGRALSRAADPQAVAAQAAAILRQAWADDPAMEAVTFAAFGAPGTMP